MKKKTIQPGSPLAKLLKRVGISKTDDWDYLLVGDGSGTTLERACGWASILISRNDQRKAFWGSFSVGTNNIAEMMAYALPLLYLSQVIPKRRAAAIEKEKPFPDVIKIHVISDSEYVVLGGKNPLRRKANGPLWQMIQRAAAESGIRISWHHDRRDISDLNKLSHELANVSRKSVSSEQLTECLQKIRRKSLERTTAFEKKISSKENSSKLKTKNQ